MSVATGIPPQSLLDPALDAEMFDALVDAVEQRWSVETELAAATLEVAHSHLLAFVRANSKKGARLPDPLQVERPEQLREQTSPVPTIRVGELAALAGESVAVKRAER